MNYLIYTDSINFSEKEFLKNIKSIECDIYHVILSVEGSEIDDFFDGHGSVEEKEVLEILKEYGLDFSTANRLYLNVNTPGVETFVRNNTNFDSDIIDENILLKKRQNYFKILKFKH